MFVICFEPCGVVKILNLVVSVIVMLYAVCHKALLKLFFKKNIKSWGKINVFYYIKIWESQKAPEIPFLVLGANYQF